MPNPSEINVGVIRIEGTNCEDESAAAFSSLGCNAEKIHLKQLLGDVEKSKKGWGLGLHTYRIDNKTVYMGNLAEKITLNICHQDQVIRPPKGAVVYAQSDFCNCAGFFIKDNRF